MARRDSARTKTLMLEHLAHIESGMPLDATTDQADLEAIFKG